MPCAPAGALDIVLMTISTNVFLLSCIACGSNRKTSASGNRPARRPLKARSGVAICSAEDVGKVSPFRSLCVSARAVSLDDLTSPDPIMEHAVGLTPDRSVGQAVVDCGTIAA